MHTSTKPQSTENSQPKPFCIMCRVSKLSLRNVRTRAHVEIKLIVKHFFQKGKDEVKLLSGKKFQNETQQQRISKNHMLRG